VGGPILHRLAGATRRSSTKPSSESRRWFDGPVER
jgi:hypothetical protein